MTQLAITNDGKNNKYVGSICILPGETKILDESLIPGRKVQVVERDPVEETDPMPELLQGKVADIVTALPTLEEDDFVRLARLEEESEKPRVSLMKAIAAEGIRRANERIEAEENADTLSGDQGSEEHY